MVERQHERAALNLQIRGFGFNPLVKFFIVGRHFDANLADGGRADTQFVVVFIGAERLFDLDHGLIQAVAQPLFFVHLVDQPRTALQVDGQANCIVFHAEKHHHRSGQHRVEDQPDLPTVIGHAQRIAHHFAEHKRHDRNGQQDADKGRVIHERLFDFGVGFGRQQQKIAKP